jgi:uncharacterized protein (UPF0262 family)
MIKNKYDELLKAEQDRIKGTSFIPSYGKMPVHNEKFNKLIKYLEKVSKDLQVANPTEYQVNLQNLIQQQLDQARLDVLLNDLEKFRKMKGDPSFFDNLLFATGFREWCGAGTDIYKNIQKDLDDPNRMFKIDTICRNHDIAYTKSKTIDDMKKADADMVFDIIEKYVVNFKKNFILGNYKSDFSNFAESYKTVYNYIISLIEAGVNMSMMYEALKNIGKSSLSFTLFGLRSILKNYFMGNDDFEELINNSENLNLEEINEVFREQEVHFRDVGLPLIVKTVGSYYFGTMIRDRIFAMGALLGIVSKTIIEELFDIEILSPTKHEVSDTDLQNIIDTFEKLQNEYQKDTNQEPVKIGNEWKEEPLEVITVEQLNNDLNDIFKLNTSYIEKVDSVVSEPITVEPVSEPIASEPVEEPIASEPDELDEEESEESKELAKSMKAIYKMFDILTKKNQEQFETNAKYIIKKISEELDNDEKNIEQVISKDLDKNINQNLFTELDEKKDQQQNVNQLNEAKNNNNKDEL